MQSVFDDTVAVTATIPVTPAIKINTFRLLGQGTHRAKSVMLVSSDSLTTAERLRAKFPTRKICVLNFANNDSFCDRKFGGITQEEDLARRTNLFHSMAPRDLYPISTQTDPHAFLISENITVIKDAKNARIAPFNIDILTAAAIINPRQIHTTQPNGEDDDDNICYDYHLDINAKQMYDKIHAILFYVKQYDYFVTGAWGMGAFNNPEYGLIKLWNRALSTSQDKPDTGPTVIFAVPGENITKKCFKRFLQRY